MLDAIGLNVLAVVVPMVGLWLWSLRNDNVSIVDIFWGCGFAAVVATAFAQSGSRTVQSYVVLATVCLWGLRLSGYLMLRNWGKPEDYRYREMREARGSSFRVSSLWIVFLFQSALVVVVSLPAQAALANPVASLSAIHFVGVGVWGIGFLFESIGDFQLRRFKANPDNRGKVLNSGLWRYSRHPNYFGNATLWWGIYLMSWTSWEASPTIVGPVVMTFMLLKVSGVSLLEQTITERRPKYREYIETTSAFFPLPPKRARR